VGKAFKVIPFHKMNDTDQLLKRILAADQEKIKPSIFFPPSSTIKATSEIARNTGFTTNETIRVFKPSKQFVIYGVCIIILFWCAIIFAAIRQKEWTDNAQKGFGIAIFCTLIITINVLYQLFYNDSYNFTIYVDINGIQVDDNLFTWDKIKETAIVTFPGGGKVARTDYLVIIFEDEDFNKYDLTNFYSFPGIVKTISRYIEYYKSSAVKSLNSL
jgi:hypothetical protein